MALGSRTDLAWRWICIAALTAYVAAYDEPYSISQMSPNSATEQRQESKMDLVLQTSAAASQDLPQLNLNEEEEENVDEKIKTSHVIVERSASLHQKDDSLHSSKNVEDLLDTNDVEVHRQPRYYDRIQPTRTQHRPDSSSPIGIESSHLKMQGEGRGVPRSRLLPQGPRPENPLSTVPKTPNSAISLRYDDTPSGRQTGGGPDIQDIITGIVKLLNGNVNVQANTQPNDGRPIRPQGTRINNRGPPRISDVPPLPPDFDTPGPASPVQMMPPPPPPQMQGPKLPPPYPFDRPPPNRERPPHRPFLDGVPLPEQIVPVSSEQGYRPNSFVNNGGRPQNIPPWQRPPRPRPQNIGNRRPNPNLPMYKPRPVAVSTEETITPPQRIETQQGLPVIKKPQYEVYMVQNAKPDMQNNEETETETIVDESTVSNEEYEENNENNETVTQGVSITDNEGGESFVKTRDPPEVPEKIVPTPSENETILPSNEEVIKKNEIEKLGLNASDNTTTIKPDTPTKQEVLKESDNSLDKKKLNMSGVKIDKEKFSTTKKQQEERTKEVELSIKNTIRLSADDAIKDINNSTLVLESTPVVIEGSMIETSTSGTSISSTPTPAGGLPAANSASSSTSSTKDTLSTKSIESSSVTVASTIIDSQPATPPGGFPYQQYRPRPGIVLDDTEYRPAGGSANSISSRRPSTGNGIHHHHLQTGKPHGIPPARGEIFDVTVSAVQGPGGGAGGATVHIESVDPLTGQPGDIIVSPSGDQGFVSIDGKRTYLDLFGGATPTVKPSHAVTGTGYAVPETEVTRAPQLPPQHPVRPSLPRRPQQPPVRIDTCIVGDDSTCDQTQNEKCKTETGISSCQCRPGFARRNHRDPCRKVVAMFFSLRVDRMYDRKVSWDAKLDDKESEPFRQLSYEAVRAVDSAFSMTPYSDEFVSGSVNAIYKGDPSKGGSGVFVNITVLLEESGETLGGSGGGGTAGVDITRHLLGVIQRRSNNVGASALWVDRPAGSISQLRDVDECSSPDLNDCHELAACTNIWGSFKCDCPSESRDMWSEQANRAGRNCLTCPSTHCNNRGACSYRAGQPVCACTGAYYGSQCEVDGEVVGVAVGASLAALLVILLTLACLVMWSRRWSREQKTAAGMGSPVFGYMTGGVKAPNMGQPPYQVSLEERMRWAQLADVMAQANHYAPEPASGHPCARPPSAMYGAYPTLPISGTLPPVPMPRLGLHMGGSTMHLNAQSGNINSGNTLASRANTLAGMGHPFAGLGMNSQHGNADSTSSESDSHAQDRADLLGSRGFHVPRPKSRSNATNSIANQSGIYYDVDYENAPDPIYGTKGIPLSTYTMNRQNFYRQ